MSLSANNLTLRIGGTTLLHDVSLAAHPGEVLGLLGPNGAGKSTLLSLLAGDRAADTGAVRLHGRDPRQWPSEKLARTRAVMTQSASVAFDFTAREVVELARLPHAVASSPRRSIWPMSAISPRASIPACRAARNSASRWRAPWRRSGPPPTMRRRAF
jgi:ABC-type hemin transport system ATPase subunit